VNILFEIGILILPSVISAIVAIWLPRLRLQGDSHCPIEKGLIVFLQRRNQRLAIGEIDESRALEAATLIHGQANREYLGSDEEFFYFGFVRLEANVRYEGGEWWMFGHELEVEVGREC
jgi:hypothetical protein